MSSFISVSDTLREWQERVSALFPSTISPPSPPSSTSLSSAPALPRRRPLVTLRQQLCSQASVHALKKPRSLRLASRLNDSKNAASSSSRVWPLNHVLDLQGHASKTLLAPISERPLFALTEISHFASDIVTGDRVVALASGEALLCFNSPSSATGAVPDGVELQTRIESPSEPATFVELDFSSTIWSAAWAHASFFHAGATNAWAVFASLPLTDRFVSDRHRVVLPQIHSELLSEEAIVGVRSGSADLDYGVQLHVVDRVLAAWCLQRPLPNWTMGVMSRLTASGVVEQLDASVFYSGARGELGVELNDLGRSAKVSCFHHLTTSLRVLDYDVVTHDGIDVGVQVTTDLDRQRVDVGAVASWMFGAQLGLALFASTNIIGCKFSKQVALAKVSHRVSASVCKSLLTGRTSINVGIEAA